LQQDTTPHFHLLARGVGRDVTTHVWATIRRDS
jgi:hypothetical protein